MLFELWINTNWKMEEEIFLGGNIHSSNSETSKMKFLSNMTPKEWLHHRREGLRSWRQFVNTNRIKFPSSLSDLGKRTMKNVEFFQSNYLCVFLVLMLYCILTSPLLLIALAVCIGACYIIHIKNKDRRIHIMGYEFTVAQQYIAVAIASFPLFWIAGAGSVIFWIIGASFVLIGIHAALMRPVEGATEEESFDLEMQPV